MENRVDVLNSIYDRYDEDARLTRDRQGQLEFFTTMEYIHKYTSSGSKILEVGAGTGRYSIALAKEGFDVSAIELVQKNLDVLQDHAKGLDNLYSIQGDATNLSCFKDNSFDITLVFGPMYHLYEKDEINKAIDEAIRVTKKDGIIMFAFLSIYAMFHTEYLAGNFKDGVELNFDKDFNTTHFKEQIFTGYDIVEFENLFEGKDVKQIKTISQDSTLEAALLRDDFKMDDEDFELYKDYHLHTCEKREILGLSNHLLYICKKN